MLFIQNSARTARVLYTKYPKLIAGIKCFSHEIYEWIPTKFCTDSPHARSRNTAPLVIPSSE